MENHRTSQELRDEIDLKSYWLKLFGFVVGFLTLIGVTITIFLVITGLEETKHQGEINQKYIRCIILLPPDTYQGSPQKRADAVDNCAVQSKLPNGTHVQGGL